jgi:hypothetical protein
LSRFPFFSSDVLRSTGTVLLGSLWEICCVYCYCEVGRVYILLASLMKWVLVSMYMHAAATFFEMLPVYAVGLDFRAKRTSVRCTYALEKRNCEWAGTWLCFCCL